MRRALLDSRSVHGLADGKIVQGKLYDAKEFIGVEDYPNIARWADAVWARTSVKRGNMVNRDFGGEHEQLPNRHSRADFPADMY